MPRPWTSLGCRTCLSHRTAVCVVVAAAVCKSRTPHRATRQWPAKQNGAASFLETFLLSQVVVSIFLYHATPHKTTAHHLTSPLSLHPRIDISSDTTPHPPNPQQPPAHPSSTCQHTHTRTHPAVQANAAPHHPSAHPQCPNRCRTDAVAPRVPGLPHPPARPPAGATSDACSERRRASYWLDQESGRGQVPACV